MKRVVIVVFSLLLGFSLIPLAAHAQAVLGTCTDEAVAARKQGKASPAGWKPGEPLIHTGKDYIGKY